MFPTYTPKKGEGEVPFIVQTTKWMTKQQKGQRGNRYLKGGQWWNNKWRKQQQAMKGQQQAITSDENMEHKQQQ